jgi:predicted HicB family RNase H-like nuclease
MYHIFYQMSTRPTYDEDSDQFHGCVIGIKDVIEFYGKNVQELKNEFKNSLDEYIDMCQEDGTEPEKPYSGRLTLRCPDPNQHRDYAIAAAQSDMSLNAWANVVLAREAERVLHS